MNRPRLGNFFISSSVKSFFKEYLLRKLPHQKNYGALIKAIRASNVIGRHPLSAQVQTISSCNSSCYFCPYQESWHKTHPGSMDDDIYRKIIKEISRYKIGKFCPYLQNEPLLDSKIMERIEYGISRLDFNILELATNASVLKKSIIDDIARLFPKVKNQIWVSFHGIDKSSHKSIMGLDFDACKSNVLALIEKAQNHNINIKIRGSGMPRIKDDKMPNWFSKEQYHAFWRNEFRKHGFKKLPAIDFFTYHDRAGQIDRNEINFNAVIRPDLKDFYCVRSDQWAHFLYTGELILCCMDYKRNTIFGDIKKNRLDDIYKSESFKTLMEQITGKTCSDESFICKKCVSPGG